MAVASERRDHLVETALRLFYEKGFHATGIDTILAEAGVAKMTLYRYFKTKDDLIVAVLELRDRRWMEWFREELRMRGKTPRKKLSALFDILGDWFRREEFRGCLFINAASEYAGLDPRVSELTSRHKKLVRDEIQKLLKEAGAKEKEARALADRLGLLVEGAIVMALMDGSAEWAKTAKEAAETLIDAALPDRSASDSV